MLWTPVDLLVIPLVFVGLHVVSYAMMKSRNEAAENCFEKVQANISDEEGPNEADFKRIMSCTRAQKTKDLVLKYVTMAAAIVGILWIFRQLDGRAVSIGAAALGIPVLFFVGEFLAACNGDMCDAAALASSVVVGPAFLGTVAYTVLQLAHRF